MGTVKKGLGRFGLNVEESMGNLLVGIGNWELGISNLLLEIQYSFCEIRL